MATSAIVVPRTYRGYSWDRGDSPRSYPQPAGLWLPSGNYLAEWKAPSRVYPRLDSQTTSTARHHWAYYDGTNAPEYRVPLTWLFGCYPPVFVVIEGPTGMSVNLYTTANGGRYYAASWTPNTTLTNQTVWIRGYMQNGNYVDWQWTMNTSSSTSHFIFVDGVNGHPSAPNGGGGTAGTGTITNPFQTMNDWYAGATGGTGSNTVSDATYHGVCVYYRAGTYNMGVVYNVAATPISMGTKPSAHLAWPGETIVFDPQTDGVGWELSGDVFIHGITVDGAGSYSTVPTVFISSGAVTDFVYFENIFQTPGTVAQESHNCAFIYFSNGAPSIAQYISVIGNIVQGTNGYELLLGYYTQYGVLEGNNFTNVVGNSAGVGQAIYLKLGLNDSWSIRGNGGLSGNTATIIELDDYNSTTNIEITYNNFKTTGVGVLFGPNPGGLGTDTVMMGRNTWSIGSHQVNYIPVRNLTYIDEVCEYTNSSANSDGILLANGGNIISSTFTGTELVALNGAFTDSNGNLLSAYQSYLGTRGYQQS